MLRRIVTNSVELVKFVFALGLSLSRPQKQHVLKLVDAILVSEVCVFISKRHPRSKSPAYFLCTNLSLSAQEALVWYRDRWSTEVETLFRSIGQPAISGTP